MIKRKNYKMIIMVITVLVVYNCSLRTVYAGGVNGNEASIVAVASGTFTYDGKKYHATQSAINTLIGYLSRDDIDLTSDQASKAIGMIYANVEAGVSGGYLVTNDTESGDSSKQDSKDSNKDSNKDSDKDSDKETKKDSNKDSKEEANKDETKETFKDSNPSDTTGSEESEDNSGIDNTEKDGSIFESLLKDISNNIDFNVADTDSSAGINQDQNNSNTIEGADIDSQSVDIDDQKSILSVENNSKLIYSDELPVKNTGFNLQITVIMLASLFILLIGGIYVTIKYSKRK